jgi:hypothetical protein
METILFDRKGDALVAEVRSGFANPGSYALILWEKNSNAKAMPDRFGNFINADDDTHMLPKPLASNDGRIIESFVVVSPPKGSKDYFASLRIFQGTRILGDISLSGQSNDPTVTLDLFALLQAAP